MPTLAQVNASRAKGEPVRLFLFTGNSFGPYAYCDSEMPITKSVMVQGVATNVTFTPWPIESSDFSTDGSLDKSDVTIEMATGSGIEDEYLGFPPDTIVNLVLYEGHVSIAPSEYRVIWRGRVLSPEYPDDEATVKFSAVPISALLGKSGLRRHYQLTCPHVLYGSKCQANKAAATLTRTVVSISGNQFTLNTPLVGPADYRSGLALWVYSAPKSSLRTILAVSPDGLTLTIRGSLRGLLNGMTVSLTKGCNRTEENCTRIFANILNYGGQPFIPLENPLSSKNQFA